MNLGPSRYAGGLFFSPPQIAKILGKCVKEIYSLIDDGILKGRRRKLVNKRAYQIHVDNLLNFLEDHPDKWDSRNVPVHVFGIEPDWMKEKRKKDMKVPNAHKRWTAKEEKMLIQLINMRYETKDIAGILGRSIGAIYRRTQELRNRNKLEPLKAQNYWTGAEINKMLKLEQQGLTDKEIADKLNRDRSHIVDKRKRLRKEGFYEGYKLERVN